MIDVVLNLPSVNLGNYNNMKFFNSKELKIVGSILLFISIISFFNFRVSIRRARDAQRKNDLGSLQEALERYHNYTGNYPLNSKDGRILSCIGPDTFFNEKTKIWENIRACDWGMDNLYDFSDLDNPVFIEPIPTDPKQTEGIMFKYLSNGQRFQLLGYLEGEDEAEFDELIQVRNINCGNKICNYGRSSGSTPLDKSIDEYENELLDKK